MNRKIKNFSDYISKFVDEENLNAIAKESKFFQRRSPITPSSFLETLFSCNAQNSPSLSHYCLHLQNANRGRVSKQAVNKRFNPHTKEMLELILKKILSSQIKSKQKDFKKLKSHFTDIRIMDSTEFKVSKTLSKNFPGYGGTGREAMVQIQYEYQLLGKNVNHLYIGTVRDSDYKAGIASMVNLSPGSLLVRDLGYAGKGYFKLVKEKKCYCISKAKTQWNYYIFREGEYVLLTTSEIINRLKNQQEKYLDIDVFVGSQNKEPMRLVAYLLNAGQKERKKKKANGAKLGKDALDGLEVNLFVTNLEREKFNSETILQLYRLRWQIELVFKTWKSVIKIDKLHSMNAVRLECTILIKLIWIMLNWSILKILETVSGKDLSFYKLCNTLKSTKAINWKIIERAELIIEWVLYLIKSITSFEKEYKKVSEKMSEI